MMTGCFLLATLILAVIVWGCQSEGAEHGGKSPSYHGYGVVDYYQVDEEYGTEEDFKRLMAEAEKRGVKVIVGLVLNHTLAQHPWFTVAGGDDFAEN